MSEQLPFGADVATYCNLFTYMGRPMGRNLDEPDIDAFVLGIPYDLATTARSGSRYGPNAIRQASAQLRWEKQRWPWRFPVFERLAVTDYGDIVHEAGNNDDMLEKTTETASAIFAAGKKLLSFGGDHFITLPLLRACHRHYGVLSLLHFDAHTDTDQSDHLYNHGSMFYFAPKEGIIDAGQSVQVGIRTEYDYDDHPYTVLDSAWVNDQDIETVTGRIRRVLGNRPIYLSFDIDCLDPAFAPGTGTPVVGGLSSDRALKILRSMRGLNIVAMDIVEVAPSYDHAEITALAAATLGLEMLYLWADR